MINAKITIMKEQFWINRVASEIAFLPLHPDTGAPLHEVARHCLEFHQPFVIDECGQPGKPPVHVSRRGFKRWSQLARS